jgi:hypothetical protein
MRISTIAALAAAFLIAGCGGDDDSDAGGGGGKEASGGGGDPSQVLKDAVAKTEDAGTARMKLDLSLSAGQLRHISADGLVDFDNQRDLLTLEVQGQKVQLFGDKGKEYFRQGTSGRYQALPDSSQTPVANNPADSLKYLGTDVVDVKEGDDDGCYEGKLDFEKVFERVQEGRENEIPEQVRGQKAPVLVCVDDEGRIVRYDVSIAISGVELKAASTISDHGEAPSLDPLGPDERPE